MCKIAVPVIAGLALLGVAGSPARAAVNLVANPGFETCTGDPSPGHPVSWDATGNAPCQFPPIPGKLLPTL